MEKVKHEDITIDVFENDIDLYLQQFKEEQDIKDLRDIPQTIWNAALIYIQRHLFTNRDMLKQHNNIYTDNTLMATNCNSYDYDLLNSICDYYIYITALYDKECSIYGFSLLTKIDYKVLQDWGHNYSNSNRLSAKSCNIYKKLTDAREQSLVAKLVSLKHPTALVIPLNKDFQYNLPGVSKEPAKMTLSSAELPKLSISSEQFAIESSGGGSDNS